MVASGGKDGAGAGNFGTGAGATDTLAKLATQASPSSTSGGTTPLGGTPVSPASGSTNINGSGPAEIPFGHSE